MNNQVPGITAGTADRNTLSSFSSVQVTVWF